MMSSLFHETQCIIVCTTHLGLVSTLLMQTLYPFHNLQNCSYLSLVLFCLIITEILTLRVIVHHWLWVIYRTLVRDIEMTYTEILQHVYNSPLYWKRVNKSVYTIIILQIVCTWATQWTIPVWELHGRFQTLHKIFFKAISIRLREEVDNDHNVQP